MEEDASASAFLSHGARTSSTTPPSSPAALPCASAAGASSSLPLPVPSARPIAPPPAPAPSAGTSRAPHRSASPLRARVVLIRHPQTEANAAHLLQGTTDSPLTALGEEQARALAGCFAQSQRRATERVAAASGEGKEGEQDSQLGVELELDTELDMDVRLIVHSPLGRTTRLATLIHTALCEESPSSHSSSSSSPSPLPAIGLRASLDLQEKSFGPLECTRRGQHAGPSWPRAPLGAKQEGREEFARRVRRAGALWIGKALEMGRARELEEEEEGEGAGRGREGEGDELVNERERAPSPTPRPRPQHRKGPPTILIVTHGLFISTFFKLFPVLPPPPRTPGFSPASSGAGGGGGELGSDSRIPFASNTGMYVLDVLPSPSRSAAGYTLRLLRANWTPHLASSAAAAAAAAGTGGKRSGREALASAARDPKQRRLDGVGGFFFKKPAGETRSAATMPRKGEQEDKGTR